MRALGLVMIRSVSNLKVNRKGGEDDVEGPRINNAITAPFVRLVTDDGHSVVPRHEALQLAIRMDMDLVEVPCLPCISLPVKNIVLLVH